MAQIDPNIVLQAGRPTVQLDNPLESQSKALQLRSLLGQQQLEGLKLQQAQQEQEQNRTLSELYRTSVNPDGSINRQAVLSGAAAQGLGNKIPGLQKQFIENEKAGVDIGHVKAQTDELQTKVMKQKLDVASGAISSLLSNPQVTHDDVITTVSNLVQQGIIPQDQGAQMVRQLPGNPGMLRQFLMQKGLETMDASKRMELMLPKTDIKDTGGALQSFQTNQLSGQITAGPQLAQKTVTPGEQLSAATQRRGQDLTNARAVDANGIAQSAARTQLVEGPNGYMLVDKGTGLARPAATMAGAQVQGKDAGLNDSQAKALLFGSRMQQADNLINGLAAQGETRGSVVKSMAEGVPVVGGLLGAGANVVAASPKQQQVEQAQRDFVNAVLRRESGASISPQEFDSAKKQYFPQVGDSPAVIQQKASNRQLATQGLMAEVPSSKRGTLAPPAGSTPSMAVPDDIAAILKKHGAK